MVKGPTAKLCRKRLHVQRVVLFHPEGETKRHARADSFPLRPREKHGGFKAINKRCSKDLQAVVDDYSKFWIKGGIHT